MSDDPQSKHPSPFALSPSAYPPPPSSKPPAVVVPSPARAMLVPELPFSSEPSGGIAPPLLAPPVLPFEAPSPTPPRKRRVLVLAGVAASAMALLALATWVVLPKLRSARPAASTAVAAPAASPSTTASVGGPPSTASAAIPSSSVVASTSASPPPPTKTFDRQAARAALDALAPKLKDCKIASGKSGRIKVAFASDGTVLSAKPLAPFAGTPRGACVAGHLKQATVPPFSGSAPAYLYSFVIPR
jgi:hypothetical protein